jgi:hypothetical protein
MNSRSITVALLLLVCWTGGMLSCYARCLRAASQPEEVEHSCCGHAEESKPSQPAPCGGEKEGCPFCLDATYLLGGAPAALPAAPVVLLPPALAEPTPLATDILVADLPVHRDLWPPGPPQPPPERAIGSRARSQGPPRD